jgi:hypothetical protein
LTITYYPSDKTPSSVTYASDNKAVATVDDNGVITAVAHGTALITATLANGREACCIVYVDTNSTIMDKNVLVYSTPSESSSDKGTMYRGTPVKVTSDKVFVSSVGTEFLLLEGYNKANEWHKVKDILPPMDKLVYFLHENERFPVCAYRHIPYGKNEEDWVWECYWGSGYTVSQLVAKNYWWKEIVPPKESK